MIEEDIKPIEKREEINLKEESDKENDNEEVVE